MGDVNDFTARRDQPVTQMNSVDEQDGNDNIDGVADDEHLDRDEGVTHALMVGNPTVNIRDTQEKFGPEGYLSLVLPCMTLFAFVADILSDIILLLKYHSEGKMTYFYWTLAFKLIPAVIVADLTWLYIDNSLQKKKPVPNQTSNDTVPDLSHMETSENTVPNQTSNDIVPDLSEMETSENTVPNQTSNDIVPDLSQIETSENTVPNQTSNDILPNLSQMETSENTVPSHTSNDTVPDLSQMETSEINNTKMQDVCRIILGLLSLGIIVRTLQHMYYKYKKRTVRKNKDYYSERVMTTKRDCAMLNFMCAFTETYSQAALQLYIFALNTVSLYSEIGFSIITSILFMTLAYADHYRSSRLQSPQGVIDKSRDMHFLVYVFYYLGVLGGMMFRLVSISMFYAAVPLKFSIPLVNLHWCGVFIWLWVYHKPSYEGMLITKVPALRYICKCLYTALYSVASMLFFVDLYEKDRKRFPSKNRMICYNVVLYVESGVFIVLGFVCAGLDIQLYTSVLSLGFVLHVLIIPIYYKCLHPTVGVCCACAETPVEQIGIDTPHSDPGPAATG